MIVTSSELKCLPSLKYVNLGYNRLEAAPSFNKAAYQTLRILVLKNNYIENLNGKIVQNYFKDISSCMQIVMQYV